MQRSLLISFSQSRGHRMFSVNELASHNRYPIQSAFRNRRWVSVSKNRHRCIAAAATELSPHARIVIPIIRSAHIDVVKARVHIHDTKEFSARACRSIEREREWERHGELSVIAVHEAIYSHRVKSHSSACLHTRGKRLCVSVTDENFTEMRALYTMERKIEIAGFRFF